jgi:AAA domain
VADRLVVVNGLPGAGKTTLARRLAPALDAPLVGKDALKEAMAAATPGIPSPALGTAASQAVWELAAAPGLLVLESWWFRPRRPSRCGSAPRSWSTGRPVDLDALVTRIRAVRGFAAED